MTSQHVVFVAADDADDHLFYKIAWRLSDVLYAAEFFSNELELLACLKEIPVQRDEAVLPDLILLDLHMPCRDRLAVAQEIQQDARLRHIPIVILTGAVVDEKEPYDPDTDTRLYRERPKNMAEYVRFLKSLETYFPSMAV